MKRIFFSLVLSFGLSVLLTPVVIYFTRKFNILDQPRSGHIHERPVPTLGGIALYIAVTFPILTSVIWRYVLTRNFNPHILGLIAGGFVIFIVGLLDDTIELRWWLKLLLQIGASCILIAFGYGIYFSAYEFQFFGLELSNFLSVFLIIVWLVAGTNASNLVDGLDGLCAGIITIASVTVATIALIRNDLIVAELMFALAGACIGFLIFNFHPAKIIMGDTGALFLGFTYAGIAAIVNMKTAALTAFVVPMIALAIPLMETAYAVIRRSRRRRSISSRDTEFFHNKLARTRLGVRGTVLYIYFITFILCVTTVVFNFVSRDYRLTILIILGVVFGLFIFLFEHLDIKEVTRPKNGR